MSAEIAFRSTVYGESAVDLGDPAENYHEASKFSPALAGMQTAGIARLTASPALQAATSRPVRRNAQLAAIDLPQPVQPAVSLWSAVEKRRSEHALGDSPLHLRTLATILDASYGARSGRRTVPSGGALYPLELYLVPRHVGHLPGGVFHFDPERRVLETLRLGDVDAELGRAGTLPGIFAGAAAIVFLTSVFWRTRSKYGLRGYRFALLEAGHAMQNLLLAAAAVDVPALPLGGFYDGRLEDMLGVDGVDESVLYCALLGGDRG